MHWPVCYSFLINDIAEGEGTAGMHRLVIVTAISVRCIESSYSVKLSVKITFKLYWSITTCMTDSEPDSITTTIRASPEKYQVTIPKEVRQGLGFDRQAALLEIEVSLVQVLDGNGNGGGDS